VQKRCALTTIRKTESDQQVGVTLKRLDMVMLGKLNEIIDTLHADERDATRKKILAPFN